MLASGMEGGANESWDQLAELLASARRLHVNEVNAQESQRPARATNGN